MSARRKPQSEPDTASPRVIVSPQFLHDLRSPLNQIIGYSEILTEDLAGAAQPASITDVGRILDAGHRMLALIEERFTAAAGEPVEVLATKDSGDERPRSSPVVAPMIAPGVLLVVDDDATNRDVLSRRLKRQGHLVETSSNGHDALRRVRESPFDLVLLDIMMPDMDGYEVLGLLKKDVRLRHIPVIMISALHEMQSIVRCIEAGAEDYLPKPFDPTLLRARIGACLEKKRGRDRETALFDQLQHNYKRLQEVEKLRDDMRNMIVHDLRTPLTSLIIGIEMLSRHGTLSPIQHEMTDIALGSARTLLRMINDLLDVEKMESGSTQLQRSALSASELVAAAAEQVRSLAEQSETTLAVEIAPGLPKFPGDENKLTRTLVNLIANAIKFTRAGTVTISVDQDLDGSQRFAVRDTGEGIPADAFERIFEKFGQVDGRKAGTGLGLAFCKLAVEAHGGAIKVESTPGNGSTFSFTIPQVTP